MGFWLKKARENPRGKASFPFGFFPGFPRMRSIRAGGFQPPGQKHSGGKFVS